ncbi:MAG: hypothetical protein VST71_13135 [Nitrospirota bacterium]|nr:hypothetical protein [Nitrospirota bacterium]
MRYLYLIFLLSALLFLPSCSGKKEVKEALTGDAAIAEEAISLAESIKEAYLKKDKAALKTLCTRNGYLVLIGSMRNFDSAEVEFTPRRVDIENNRVMLYMEWEGKWFLNGKEFPEKGLAVFELKGSPLKLNDILRANPFRQPEG